MFKEVLADNKITLHVSSNSETGLLSAFFNELMWQKVKLHEQLLACTTLELSGWTELFACCGNCYLVLAFSSTDTEEKLIKIHI